MKYLPIAAVLFAIAYFILRLRRNTNGESAVESIGARATPATDAAAEDDAAEDDGPPISIVALMTEPLFLDVDVLKRSLEKDFGVSFEDSDPTSFDADTDDEAAAEMRFADADNFAMTTPMGTYMVRVAGHMHGVIAEDDGYFEDIDAAIASVNDLRAKQALEEHRCWIAVDHLGDEPEPPDLRETYARIGRLLLSLIDPALCTAVLLPHAEKFYPWRDDMVVALASGDVLGELSETAHVPVTTISDNDEDMQAAVATAHRRWPEFRDAFTNNAGEAFGVKFFLSGDHEDSGEFPWMEVTAIHGEIIQGRLANEPIGRSDLHEGSKVTTRLAELNDWLFVDADGKQQGGFTIPILLRGSGGDEETGDD